MAKVEETDALMSLNRACQEAFPREDNTYWPHLSLVYGSISMEARAKVKAEIESKSEWSSVVGSSCLIDTIEIWNTEGDPNGWEMAGVVKLGP
ncbi:hypothetical protein HK101_008786 [Irineochytrium annulatum]|nr:hypothetical protein HK101_008786 [Irineochytrium annulatum]